MSEHTASTSYAFAQLLRALDSASAKRTRQWGDVLRGVADGSLSVGSRTPVSGTPPWVTLEVAHGGFATGRLLAETAELDDDEVELLALLPDDAPGRTDRERLNWWHLGDEGGAALLELLASGEYRVETPEEAAIPAVVVLLAAGRVDAAVELLDEITPWLHRLRFAPRRAARSALTGTVVRRLPVSAVADGLRRVAVPAQVETMRATLGVWNPLHDELVDLWASTVEGELPGLDEHGAVRGGWPCQVWPQDWAERRAAWFAAAARAGERTGRHAHPRSNFTRLRSALARCGAAGDVVDAVGAAGSGGGRARVVRSRALGSKASGAVGSSVVGSGAVGSSAALTAREIGWVRRALANALTRRGSRHAELRAEQAAVVALPTHAAFAAVLAERLSGLDQDGGLPRSDAVSGPARPGEGLPEGSDFPEHLLARLDLALEAPVAELVRRGVVPSGEVLAEVLPQVTARLLAAGLADPVAGALREQAYGAFRRRRSLLLVDLASQVRFEELPWVAALDVFRSAEPDAARAAREALEQTALLALTAFPHTITPNPLVSEFAALAGQAQVRLPLVEEIAADIFMGRFTEKWHHAAVVAHRVTRGTPYAAYYDLTEPAPLVPERGSRSGRRTAEWFGAECGRRAKAGATTGSSGGSWVAERGMVLEQSQVLTTHNLAVLVDGLGLGGRLRRIAPEAVGEVFAWIARRLAQPVAGWHAGLLLVKNVAYAWRQAVFLLGYCDERERGALIAGLRERLSEHDRSARFEPAVAGLEHVLAGGRFTEDGTTPNGGRRLLGWTTGEHWLLERSSR
ncbi:MULTISPECIES: hypothetical protein [Actinosynnema]|uniref:hypothetical protein n=1 Tax=Actinosynnema TaxID=40566 RepID=UPI0020A5D324|nr:hypothetical protein [Actinosynnema pretiosum]MCP2098238.1 hypothetical protein [Actinosynnema pretiosum]